MEVRPRVTCESENDQGANGSEGDKVRFLVRCAKPWCRLLTFTSDRNTSSKTSQSVAWGQHEHRE
jgi:hypothetical protein